MFGRYKDMSPQRPIWPDRMPSRNVPTPSANRPASTQIPATTSSASRSARRLAAGTYQPSTGQAACLDADPGHYVATTGQTSQSICLPGTYQPSVGQTSCIDADAGSIVANNSHYTDIDYTKPISAGGLHTCAVRDDGSVACWGENGNGQLGDGTTTNRDSPTQTASLGAGRTAVAISAGGQHTCALLDDGSVTCWGYNGWGVIGDGTNTDRHTPTQTASLGAGRTAVAISARKEHTCALLDDGTVACRGENFFGQAWRWHRHSRL